MSTEASPNNHPVEPQSLARAALPEVARAQEAAAVPPPTTSSKWRSRDIRECSAAIFGECPSHVATA